MNEQFIQGVIFDWNRIDNNSYLKKIEAFKGVTLHGGFYYVRRNF